jgi:hypothetical protein
MVVSIRRLALKLEPLEAMLLIVCHFTKFETQVCSLIGALVLSRLSSIQELVPLFLDDDAGFLVVLFPLFL